jgi:hypothetical protein
MCAHSFHVGFNSIFERFMGHIRTTLPVKGVVEDMTLPLKLLLMESMLGM